MTYNGLGITTQYNIEISPTRVSPGMILENSEVETKKGRNEVANAKEKKDGAAPPPLKLPTRLYGETQLRRVEKSTLSSRRGVAQGLQSFDIHPVEFLRHINLNSQQEEV